MPGPEVSEAWPRAETAWPSDPEWGPGVGWLGHLQLPRFLVWAGFVPL